MKEVVFMDAFDEWAKTKEWFEIPKKHQAVFDEARKRGYITGRAGFIPCNMFWAWCEFHKVPYIAVLQRGKRSSLEIDCLPSDRYLSESTQDHLRHRLKFALMKDYRRNHVGHQNVHTMWLHHPDVVQMAEEAVVRTREEGGMISKAERWGTS